MAEELTGVGDDEGCGRAGGMDGQDLHAVKQPASREKQMHSWKLSGGHKHRLNAT